MNIKKIVLFTVILMIAVSSLSAVSAGWFDFLNFGKTDTYMLYDTPYNEAEGAQYVAVILEANYTNGTHNPLLNKTIHVNVTNENGTTNSYNVNSTEGYVKICKLTPGNYTISAVFSGDDQYNSCNLTDTKEVKNVVLVNPQSVDVKDNNGNLVNRYYVST